MKDTPCLGCRLAQQQLPVHVIYETEALCCILDHDPFEEGHTLILPKQHVRELEEMEPVLLQEILQTASLISQALKQLLQPDGITVCQNGGIFSELEHYHMHVVPRYQGRSFQHFYDDTPLDNKKEKAALAETALRMREALARIADRSTIGAHSTARFGEKLIQES
ncbi:HIT family protein [Ectobacillus ponti]|uniref:HIT family protein n=1 Tax=Ectobacillus ponti TaxID=2961894 RepID=A0AA41XAA0_9BACI|nr:HIT family protein [Ectobacillus ponti]MCP8969619.1 HIT family protein [Ectobacillus ponti]